uniref:alpha/beta fold hydrolase n=1 Tax=Fulvivirga sp. TaxID=1931237 RepID=UPI004048EAED
MRSLKILSILFILIISNLASAQRPVNFLTRPILSPIIFHQNSAEQKYSLTVKKSGKGQAVIFIPGLTCDGSVWDGTVKDLGSNYESHVFTLPGFSGSKPLENLDNNYLGKMTNAISDYIRSNKLGKVTIVGHSLGGFLAMKIALSEPDLVSKMILVDALPFLPAVRNPSITNEQAEAYALNYKQSMLQKGNLPKEEKIAAQKEFLDYMISDSVFVETAIKWYLESDNATVAQAMYEMNTTDLRDELTKIEVPTLVLGSWVAGKPYGATKEGALRSYKDQFAKLTNVKIDMSETGKHFIMWDDPEFLNEWLKKFL